MAQPATSACSAVDFLSAVGALKTNKRTGWVRAGVAQPESVADHMYRMAVAALLCADSDAGLDPAAAAVVALAHDLPEAITGDIVPGDVPAAEKRAREAAALDALCAGLEAGGFVRAAATLRRSYDAYERQSTPEARFVKSLDKLEMLLQAHEYECADPSLELGQFFASTPLDKLPMATVRSWAEEVAARRRRAAAQRHPGQPAAHSAAPASGRGPASAAAADGARPSCAAPETSSSSSPPPAGASWRLQGLALAPPAAFWAGAAVGAVAGAALMLAHRSR